MPWPWGDENTLTKWWQVIWNSTPVRSWSIFELLSLLHHFAVAHDWIQSSVASALTTKIIMLYSGTGFHHEAWSGTAMWACQVITLVFSMVYVQEYTCVICLHLTLKKKQLTSMKGGPGQTVPCAGVMEKLSTRRSVPVEGPSRYTEAFLGALSRISFPCSCFHSWLFACTLHKSSISETLLFH
jgi:hypothetical protein